MMMLRIEYDNDNKCFKILEHDPGPLFEQGDMYVLGVTESGDPEVEFIEFCGFTVARV